jgi:hypothetical protein
MTLEEQIIQGMMLIMIATMGAWCLVAFLFLIYLKQKFKNK